MAAALAAALAGAAAPAPAPAPKAPSAIAAAYGATATRILEAAARDTAAFEKLSWLTDRIGNRLSGSPALAEAVRWAAAAMTADGHENVHTEKVMVPHWVRGAGTAELVAPVKRPLSVLALGGSVGTPAKGITAEVVVVSDFDALAKLGPAVKGKIVLYDHPMPPYGPKGSGYGESVAFRNHGAPPAAKLGALAVLVRSATARSLGAPHTGMTAYDPAVPRIPAAALSVEDAELLARLARAGAAPRVRLVLGARTLPDAESANVLGELRGASAPDEVVVIGAHLDSWDVGAGAHDDGAGCAIVMGALKLLRDLGLRPRRTIRVVLFTNEENGLRGAKGYAAAHAAELARHVAAIEADSGAFAPKGFTLDAAPGDEEDPATLPAAAAAAAAAARARVAEITALLAPLGATAVDWGDGGADIGRLGDAGVPLLGLEVDGATYFDYHHSAADTLDKVDPAKLRDCVGAMAVAAYVLADLPEPLLVKPAP